MAPSTEWSDDEFIVVRANEGSPEDRVPALTVTVSPGSGPSAPSRLRHYFDLRALLDGSWAAVPVALSEHGGLPALVLEDPGGEPLSHFGSRALDLETFLEAAVAISQALARLHDAGLVHKDLKPANILVDMRSKRAWLIGLGIASRLPRERQTPLSPEVNAGSFAYMAPEQTGRMNRSIDTRSDLYALGVVFYEMLLGELPFRASDSMEWIHCHVARLPIPPAERMPSIPAVVSDLVMKLLSKAAEDRYQTADGLHADLQRCLFEWRDTSMVRPFELGTRDGHGRLSFQEKLYGRQDEVTRLSNALDEVMSTGASKLILVSGFSGIGKSSVVNELHRVLVPSRGMFATGKFDQYRRGIPYAPLAEAFQGLVRQLLGKADDELQRWRGELSEALENNGQLIINLVPELEHVIGVQPAVPSLSGPESVTRMNLVVRRFLRVFAPPQRPLILFLDDLQWLDAATLEVFEHLATHPDVQNVLLIGAYRDNEVGLDHPLAQRITSIKSSRSDVVEINLQGIATTDLAPMIGDAIHTDADAVRSLVDVVMRKTGGSPFMTIQFISALVDDGFLFFDRAQSKWRWDINAINAKGVSDNVVDLLIDRLRRLPHASLDMVTGLACMGGRVEVGLLTRIHNISESGLEALLSEALRLDLLIRLDDAYVFAHDRVQEAAYAILSQEERGQRHLLIGTRMLEMLDEGERETYIFQLASQFRSASRLNSPEARSAAADVFLQASLKARASAAFAEASELSHAGVAQLREGGWLSDYDLMFRLTLQYAECLFLTGEIFETERVIEASLHSAQKRAHKAALYRLRIELYVVLSENEKAVATGIEALQMYDLEFEPHPSFALAEAEFHDTLARLDGKPLETLCYLPPTTDPDLLGMMAIFGELLPPALFTDFNLVVQLSCRSANINLKHGFSYHQGYVWLALLVGHAFGAWKEGYRLGEAAVEVSDRLDALQRARVRHMFGTVCMWTQPFSSVISRLRSAVKDEIAAGDLYFSCFAYAHIVTLQLQNGDDLSRALAEAKQFLEFGEVIHFPDGHDMIVSTERTLASLLGLTKSLSSFDDDQFSEKEFESNFNRPRLSTVIYWYWSRKVMLHYLAAEYEQAVSAAAKADPGPYHRVMQVQNLDLHYFAALAIAALLRQGTREDHQSLRDRLMMHHGMIKRWSEETGAPTYVDKVALTSAEIARLDGKREEAERLYDEAIRAAEQNGFIHNSAVSHEVAASFYHENGRESIARALIAEALKRYASWGAVAKVRQLEQIHGISLTSEDTSWASANMSAHENLDLATVLEVSRAISGEIVLERMIDRLMRLTMEHAGAARASLLLWRPGGLVLVAEAVAQRDVVVMRAEDEFKDASFAESVLQYVGRTQEIIVLDDALVDDRFNTDSYVRGNKIRSLLAMPLINQAKSLGILYLENNLATRVFTPNRIATLKLIASQAAMALEGTLLYRDLEEREAKIRRLIDSNIIGIFMWTIDGRILDANEAFLKMFGYDRQDLNDGRLNWAEMSPPEGAESDAMAINSVLATGVAPPWEKEYIRKDGTRVPVLVGASSFGDLGSGEGVAFVLDLTDRKVAEEAARESEQRFLRLQGELAHANRIATLGQLSATIAHEVRQPLSGVVASGSAGLNWLAKTPPNVPAAVTAIQRAVSEGHRAAETIDRIRTLAKKSPPRKEPANLNTIIDETIKLVAPDAARKRVSLSIDAAPNLPAVALDRIQIQQVILNLVINAVDAIWDHGSLDREVTIATRVTSDQEVAVTVTDTGPGISTDMRDRLFNAFFSSKQDGLGLGLAICQSIIESHGGRLLLKERETNGTAFEFRLQIDQRAIS